MSEIENDALHCHDCEIKREECDKLVALINAAPMLIMHTEPEQKNDDIVKTATAFLLKQFHLAMMPKAI